MKRINNLTGLALTLIASYVVILSYICIRRYFSFAYNDWDLAIYSNAMWNLLQGKFYISLFAEHFFRDHASFIAFLIAVPYAIFRHPVVLLILQSLALGLSAVPVFLIAREKLDELSAVIITLLYLGFPAIYYANLYEFYFEAFAVPFLSFAFYFLIKNKKLPFLLAIVGACSCKENIPLTISALGIFGLLRPKRRVLGLVALILGLVWFYLDIKFLASFSAQKTATFGSGLKYGMIYKAYGSNLNEVFRYMLTHPFKIVRDIFSHPSKVGLFSNTTGILLFLPLLRPDILMINVPHILARLLSFNSNEYTIYFHSAAPLAPFVFFAFIYSLKSMFKEIPHLLKYKYFILAFILFFSLTRSINLWNFRPGLVRFKLRNNPVKSSFLKDIPVNAPIAASFQFLPHLSNREKIYSIHTVFGHSAWKNPKKDMEYILIDTKDSLLRGMSFENEALFDKNFFTFLNNNNFSLVKARGDIVLFKKDNPANESLLSVSSGNNKLPDSFAAKIDDGLVLLSYDYKVIPENNGILQLSFSWYKENQAISDYGLRFFITEGGYDKAFVTHLLGYSILPPSLWQRGDIIRENYWLVLPKLSPGEHSISFDVIDAINRRIARIDTANGGQLDQFRKYKLLTFIK